MTDTTKHTGPQWVSVKDRLPKKKGQYLCWILWHDGGDYDCCQFARGVFWCYGDRTEEVTHWMPLPEPPKTGDSNAKTE